MEHAPARIRLWDLPIRLFHWLLLVLMVAAVVTGKVGGNAIDWHARIGLAILGLLAFRIVWGVIGSTHARFASFAPTPGRLAAYLRGRWHGVGHNPLGALSVFALLGLIGFQVGSGLLGNDDIAFNGPLYPLIDKALSDRFSSLHRLAADALLVLIALHVAAIAFYTFFRKERLVGPMIHGWKERPPPGARPATGGGPLAVVVALLLALGAVYAGSGDWIAPPPPPPASAPATPDW